MSSRARTAHRLCVTWPRCDAWRDAWPTSQPAGLARIDARRNVVASVRRAGPYPIEGGPYVAYPTSASSYGQVRRCRRDRAERDRSRRVWEHRELADRHERVGVGRVD